jgi:hypothetical protein
MMLRLCFLIPVVTLGIAACAGTPDPSGRLARRAAEGIDPRLPIASEEKAGPVSPSLTATLSSLVSEAEAGRSDFDRLAGEARAAVNAAGPPQSESWIVAQQRLSVLIRARAPVTKAMGDVDALGAQALAQKGGLPAGDRLAVEQAADRVSTIDEAQAAIVKELTARLGG